MTTVSCETDLGIGLVGVVTSREVTTEAVWLLVNPEVTFEILDTRGNEIALRTFVLLLETRNRFSAQTAQLEYHFYRFFGFFNNAACVTNYLNFFHQFYLVHLYYDNVTRPKEIIKYHALLALCTLLAR